MPSRRDFLALTSGAGAALGMPMGFALSAEAAPRIAAKLAIEDVQLFKLAANDKSLGDAIYLVITADNGLTGVHGPLFEDQAFTIHRKLRPLLLKRDPLAIESLWEPMQHDRHSRGGQHIMAISAVDIALWDLKGKCLNLPLYRLLGGPTRDRVPVYASMLGHSVEPVAARKTAREFFDKGFTSQKWFLRFGPGDGSEGKRKNIELVRTLREELGDDAQLMFDGMWAWDGPYSLALAKEILVYRPTWLEEPVRPEHLEVFRQLKRDVGIPLAAGEHLHTRWDVKPYLDAGALNFVQTDPEWTGGLTESLKICALAETYGVPVIPHGHHIVPALHLIASRSARVCPMAEYLVKYMPSAQRFQKEIWRPENGSLPLPTAPGLGVAWDEAKIASTRLLTWE